MENTSADNFAVYFLSISDANFELLFVYAYL